MTLLGLVALLSSERPTQCHLRLPPPRISLVLPKFSVRRQCRLCLPYIKELTTGPQIALLRHFQEIEHGSVLWLLS